MSGTLSSTVEVSQSDGASATKLLPSLPYVAKFQSGAAALVAGQPATTLGKNLAGMVPMVAVAASVSDKPSQKDVEFKDAAGHVNRLVIKKNGNRILSTSQTVDGVVFAEINNRWKLQGATWTLQGTEVVSSMYGRTVRLSLSTIPSSVAYLSGLGAAKRRMEGAGHATLGLFTPAVAYASPCTTAWFELISTSGALAMALAAPPPIDFVLVAVLSSAYAGAVSEYADSCHPQPT